MHWLLRQSDTDFFFVSFLTEIQARAVQVSLNRGRIRSLEIKKRIDAGCWQSAFSFCRTESETQFFRGLLLAESAYVVVQTPSVQR